MSVSQSIVLFFSFERKFCNFCVFFAVFSYNHNFADFWICLHIFEHFVCAKFLDYKFFLC